MFLSFFVFFNANYIAVETLKSQVSFFSNLFQGPPSKIVALDLLGFGHSSKPGLTYTQHLWEAQVVHM